MTANANPATWLAGYIPDLPTPFDEKGAVDLAAFAKKTLRTLKEHQHLADALPAASHTAAADTTQRQ